MVGGYGLLLFAYPESALRIFKQNPTPNKIKLAKVVGAIELALVLTGFLAYAIAGFPYRAFLNQTAWKSAAGQFVGLVFFTPYNQRVKPLGRNPSRAVYPRKVVVRKITPTTNARRQPEQVMITGSEGELIICPPNFRVLRGNVGLKANEFKGNCKSLDEHAYRAPELRFRLVSSTFC